MSANTALGLPDLAVSLASIGLTPSAPAPGLPTHAAVVVANVGEQASDQVPVRLYELSNGERAEVPGVVTVPVLQPGETFLAEWDWTFGLIDGAQAVSVEVDRDNALREFDEHNNEATLLIDVQSGDAFVTEPYFSPNGDGVRDRTRAVFADGAGVLRIVIANHAGRIVRALPVEAMGSGAVGAVWDGRGDDGRIQPDARYSVSAESDGASPRGLLFVTLDTDRTSALEAVQTSDGVYRQLPTGTTWRVGADGTSADGFAFTQAGRFGNDFAELPGVYKTDLLLGGRDVVVSAGWLEAYALSEGLVELLPNAVYPLPDGRLLLEMVEIGGDNGVRYFTHRADEVDRPQWVASIPFRPSVDLMGVLDDGRVWFSEFFANHGILLLDLEAGTVLEAPLDGLDVDHVNGLEQTASGWLVHGEAESFFQSVNVTEAPRPLLDFVESGARLVEPPHALPGSDRVLFHLERSTCDAQSALEYVQLTDVVSGQTQRLHSWPPADLATQVCQSADSAPVQKLRTFWLEQERVAVVVDHAERTLARFASGGALQSLVGLPDSLRRGPYANGSEAHPGERRPVCGACHQADGGGAEAELEDEWSLWRRQGAGNQPHLFDPSRDLLYATVSESFSATDLRKASGSGNSGGARDYLEVSAEGEVVRLGGSTTIALENAEDNLAYPFANEYLPPDAWPQLIQSSGARLRTDTRVEIPATGRLTAPWLQASLDLFDIPMPTPSPSGARLLYQTKKIQGHAFEPRTGRTYASFSTLERLTSKLQARSDGRAITLSGLATDRNFQHFSIDWAALPTPDVWQSLVPPSAYPVRFDEFLTWSPPAAGAYLFRLTVVDRAGNRSESFSTADSLASAALANLRQDFRAISPNGDGVQDATTLSFTVLRATAERIEVRDLAGRLFRTVDLLFGGADLGPQQWTWDGRDDGGARVPDGRYRIELVSGFALRVDVDTQAPGVEALLTGADDLYDGRDLRRAVSAPLLGLGPIIDFRIEEVFAGERHTPSWTFESAPVDAEAWQAFEPWRIHEYVESFDQALLSAEQYRGRRFRLVAEDAAGNRTVRSAGSSAPALLFLHAGKNRAQLPDIQPPPRGRGDDAPLYQASTSANGALTPTVVAPSADQQLYALDLAGDVESLTVDTWQSGPGGSGWVAAVSSGPTALSVEDGAQLPQFASGMVAVPFDFSGRPPREQVTMRLRGQYAGGIEEVSNAMTLQIGGVDLSCSFLDEQGQQTRLYDFVVDALLEPPVRSLAIEVERVAACEGSSCPPPILRFPNLNLDGDAPEFGMPPVAVLRAQLGLGPLDAVRFRATADDATGRRVPSSWNNCQSERVSAGVLTMVPVIAPTCEAVPTGAVQARMGLAPVPGYEYRLRIASSVLGAPQFIAVSPDAGASASSPSAVALDTTAWPEGEYSAAIEERSGSGAWLPVQGATDGFFVDRTPPEVELETPLPGDRICAIDWDREMWAWIDDAHPVGYRFEQVGSPEPQGCEGIEATDLQADGCDIPAVTGAVRRFSLQPPVEAHGYYRDSLDGVNVLDLRLRAFDWSGAQVCAVAPVQIDGVVELEQRAPSSPLLPASGRVGIRPGSGGTWNAGRWQWLAREQISWSVTLHDLIPAQGTAPARVDPTALATLVTDQAALGEFDFTWDGFSGGAPVEDGSYALRFTAEDDCGNRRVVDRFVDIDATPPDLSLLSPEQGATLRAVTVPVVGTVEDAHIMRFDVAVSLSGAGGPWVSLASGTRNLSVPTVLTQWAPGSATGAAWLQLSARDELGNLGEAIHQVTLIEPSALFLSASMDPLLFSPNADARSDETRARFEMSTSALLDAAVLSSSGTRVRTLEAARSLSAGNHQIIWDGRDDGGTVVADGAYRIELDAVEADNPGNVDRVVLQSEVDATPPQILIVQPNDGYARCDESALVQVSDEHLDFFEARIEAGGVAPVVISGRGTGTFEVADFEGRSESEYALSVIARDLAGTDAESEQRFTLDCTAPEASLLLENLTLRSRAGESVVVGGLARDDHFLRYRVELSSEDDPDVVETLIDSSQPADDGELLVWTPEQADGEYRLRLVVEDLAGNVSTDEQYVTLDGTPPTAEIALPLDGQQITPRFELRGTALDDHFDAFRIEAATPAQSQQDQWSVLFRGYDEADDALLGVVDLPLDGEFDLRLVVSDAAGNESTDQVRVSIDTLPPAAPALQGVLLDAQTARLTWQVSSSDTTGVRLYRNGAPWADVLLPALQLNDTQVPEGTQRYHAVAFDQAGNLSASSNVVELSLDRTPPEVRLLSAPGERIRGAFAVRGTARGQNGDLAEWTLHRALGVGALELVRRSDDEIAAGVMAQLDTTTLANETPIRLRLAAVDAHGNTSATEVTVVADNAPPAAPTGLVALEQPTGVRLDWDPNTEADLHGYLLYRGGSLIGAGGSLPADLRSVALRDNFHLDISAPDGPLTYRVYAIDQAGNLSTASNAADIDRDAGPPHLTLLRPQPGEVFDDALELLALSDDRDIAQVEFTYRAAGESVWQTLGPAVTTAPWRSTFAPGALPFATYELRAVATDVGGQVDPDPPVVEVVYADQTPPAPPTGTLARAEGADVRVNWLASPDVDVVSYRVERVGAGGGWWPLQTVAATIGEVVDAGRPLGEHRYRVLALDRAGNASEPSAADVAHVFALTLTQPYTPTSADTTSVIGQAGARGGRIDYRVQGAGLDQTGSLAQVGEQAPFTIDGLPLAVGLNRVSATAEDIEGNRSIEASVQLRRAEIPLPPASLDGILIGHAVDLNWPASVSSDIVGYRVYRNEQPVLPDADIGQPLQASTPDGDEPSLVDDDLQTGWSSDASGATARLPVGSSVVLAWDVPELVSGLRIDFTDASLSARAWRLFAWNDEFGWVELAARDARSAAAERLRLDVAYPTRRLRLDLLEAQAPGAIVEIAELMPQRRSFETALSAHDDVGDGVHRYQVSALNAYGIEGARSAIFLIEVGDTDPPPPVTLSGVLNGDSVTLDWTESAVPDLRGYVVLRDDVSVATVDAAQPRSFVDTGLPNGHFVYTVQAEDQAFNRSAPSNPVAFDVAVEGPGQPLLQSVEQVDDGTLDIRWQAGPGPVPVSYRLFVAAAENDPAQPYVRLLDLGVAAYLHAGLAPGSYWYRVQAFDARGNASALSAPLGGVVDDLSAPLRPEILEPVPSGGYLSTTDASQTICGVTSPGVPVRIERNGVVVATTMSASALPPRPLAFATGADVALSYDANGLLVLRSGLGGTESSVWYDSNGAVLHQANLGAQPRMLRTSTDWTHFALFGAGEIGRFWYGSDHITSFGSFADVVDMAVSSDGFRLLILQRDAGGDHLKHVYRVGGIPTWEDIALPVGVSVRAGSLSWRSWRDEALFADESGLVYRYDADAQSVEPVGEGAVLSGPWASPEEDGWFVVDQAGRVLYQPDVGESTEVWLSDGRAPLSLAWSADGFQLAAAYADGIEIRDATTATLSMRIEYAPLPADRSYRLDWGHPQFLLLTANVEAQPALLVEVTGRFCAPDIAMLEGDNEIVAIAGQDGAAQSEPSDPIVIDYAQSGSAGPDGDFELWADDVLYFPAAPRLGETRLAFVPVYYDVEFGSLNFTGDLVRGTLTLPDGTQRGLRQAGSYLLQGSGQINLPMDLGVMDQLGTYVLELSADPDDRFGEWDESNNHFSVAFVVDDLVRPQLTLRPFHALAPPGGVLDGELELFNPGPVLNGRIEIDIAGEDGVALASLLDRAVQTVAAGQRRSWTWSYTVPAQLLGGAYTVRARLFGADDQQVAEARQMVSVSHASQFRLDLQPARTHAVLGEPLPVQVEVEYEQGNQVFSSGTIRLLAQRPDGSVRTLWQGSTGVLLPGYVLRRDVVWLPADQQAGWSDLRLEFVAGDVAEQTTREVELTVSGQLPVLRGSVELVPGAQWQLGQPASLAVRIENASTVPIVGASYRLRVLADGESAAILDELAPLTLGVASTFEFDRALSDLPQRTRAHVARLEARLADDPAGTWRRLASLSFQGVDAEAPELSVLTPSGNSPVRMPTMLALRAADRHSRIDRVEYRVDGGSWRLLGETGLQGYESSLSGLAEGEHHLAVRAVDIWANEARIDDHRFVVDLTPPQILIDGVEDGGLYNHSVAASIQIVDAHADGYLAWLNGVPYAGGTDITLEGVQHLRVMAVDLAGHRSERVLEFSIDLTAPPLQIVDPAGDDSTHRSQIDVLTQTEPGATVHLASGAQQRDVIADAGGQAFFTGVALALGSNLIEVQATDAAGNDSPVHTRTIERLPLSGVLSGSVLPTVTSLGRGSPLDVMLRIENGTETGYASLPWRLRALAPGDQLVFEESSVVAVATAETAEISRQLDSTTWPWGPVTLVLDIDEGSGWQQLDSAIVEVLDVVAPSVSWLEPSATSIQPQPTTMRASAEDDRGVTAVEYRVDGGGWMAMGSVGGNAYEASAILAEGLRVLDLRARDAADNRSPIASLQFVVDGTPPQIAFAGVEEGATVATPVAVTAEVTDAHPGSLQLTLDGQPYAAGSAIAGEGAHTVQALAIDAAGNQAERSLTFTIDTTAPSVALVQPEDGSIVAQNSVLVLVHTEASAFVHVTAGGFDAQTQADAVGNVALPDVPLALGENLIVATARDAVGNTSAPVQVHVFRSDVGELGLLGNITTDPALIVEGSAFDLVYVVEEHAGLARSGLQLRLTVRPTGSMDALITRDAQTDLAADASFERRETVGAQALTLGQYIAELQVLDEGVWAVLAGQAFSVVDGAAPVVSILGPPDGSVHATNVTLRASVVDQSALESVQARADGGPWISMAADAGAWMASLALPREGDMQLEVRARDVLGNQSAPVAVSIRSDQSAPSINIAGVVDGQRSRDPVTPVIEVTDASPTSVTATLNGAPFASGTTVAEEGGYLLAVEAVDSVGWSSQANVAFTIDRTAPTLSVSHPVSGSTVLSGQLDVLGQTEPFARVELELGATTRAVVADASGAFAFASVQLGAGSNTLRLRALDDLDNASAWLTLDVVWAQALPPAREIPLLGPWALLFGALGFVLLAGTRMHAGRKRA